MQKIEIGWKRVIKIGVYKKEEKQRKVRKGSS